MSEIQKVFGELKVNKYEFTNGGARHVQCPKTLAVSLDQIHVANTLKPIAHPQVSSGNDDDEVGAELHALYRSLLSAHSPTWRTRVWTFLCSSAPFSATLQHPEWSMLGSSTESCAGSSAIRRSSTFAPFDRTTVPHLRVVSDAAFKKEPEDGYSLRGALFLRCESSSDAHSASARTGWWRGCQSAEPHQPICFLHQNSTCTCD